MEIKNIPKLPDEAFVVEAIIPLERVLVKAIDAIDPPEGVLAQLAH